MARPQVGYFCGLCGKDGQPRCGRDGEWRVACPPCERLWMQIDGYRPEHGWLAVPPAIQRRSREVHKRPWEV